jgi:monoamine oxidase
MDKIDAELAHVMGGLVHLGKKDITFAEYLRRHKGGSADARKFAISFVQGFDAADPNIVSAQSIAAEQEGLGDVENETQFRPLGGYASLIHWIHQSLNPRRVTLKLNTPVTEIRWRRNHIQVRSGHKTTFTAKRVLITIPLGILHDPRALRFTPEISDWRDHASRLAFGSVVKAILRFHRPFWEDDKNLRDTTFLHNPTAKFPTFWTARPLRAPILTAWAGGPSAVALCGLTREQTLRAALESLSPLVRRSPRSLENLLQQFFYCDWLADPFARGAYSYVAVNGMTARSHLSKPIDNTLFFAGEALDISGQASTVAGALASGQRAARQLLSVI